MLHAGFAFDRKLERVVRQANEPILAQMKLAWWRDRLREEAAARPKGDPLLDALGREWNGREVALISLVDGWEATLGAASRKGLGEFAKGRALLMQAWADAAGASDDAETVKIEARRWSYGDAAAAAGETEARELAMELESELPRRARLTRALRPLAILAGLAERSIAAGGVRAVEDRGAMLAAMRIALLGR
ncbi:hypothetical protein HUV48_02285 [Altererythrobacter sp. HHU K3-1]|uniref:Phytoene synthase n=2 Tax=Qipengyuania atrilutea TaxID=2744473 RepID=A0A850H425_9SPHN|nr:hypothetical protein [Actirhodobacter atriluteus]NVD43845.1 hypothetical protein [Actirhodobacter atriluteus]